MIINDAVVVSNYDTNSIKKIEDNTDGLNVCDDLIIISVA